MVASVAEIFTIIAKTNCCILLSHGVLPVFISFTYRRSCFRNLGAKKKGRKYLSFFSISVAKILKLFYSANQFITGI